MPQKTESTTTKSGGGRSRGTMIHKRGGARFLRPGMNPSKKKARPPRPDSRAVSRQPIRSPNRKPSDRANGAP